MQASALSYMQGLPVFKAFTAAELEMLSTVFAVRHLPAGKVLCREKDSYASLIVVVAGAVTQTRELPGGRRLSLGRAGPGAVLGQKSLIDGRPRSATLEAKQPTIALECNRADFQRLFKANSPFAYKMLDVVVQDRRLRSVDAIVDRALSDPARTISSVLAAMSQASGLLAEGQEEALDEGPKAHHLDLIP
jgi:CRP-like cAMP-binding protein